VGTNLLEVAAETWTLVHTQRVIAGAGDERMSDHQALVNSLGEYTVSVIGSSLLRGFTATYDVVDGVVHAEICLREDTWDSRAIVIDKMTEVREMFLGEVSIDYAFTGSQDECGTVRAADSEFAFAI